MTFAQGLSRHITPSGAVTTKDAQICGGPGTGGAGGGGGAATSGAGGSAPTMDMCPMTFEDPNPSFQTEEVTPLVVASLPVLRPAGCNGEYETLSLGTVYVGDCHGVTAFQPFTEDDITTFFRGGTDLFPATELPINGSEVTLVSGVAVKTAMIGSTLYAVSNVSSKLIKYDTSEPDPLLARTELDLGTKGISGLLALGDGTMVFTTIRSFTVDSWNSASKDPAVLVEAEPIHVMRYDPAMPDMPVEIATISGASRVKGQNATPATKNAMGEPTSFYIAGTANMTALAQDGSLLVSDRLDGKVYKVALDGTVTLQFTLPDGVLISGLTQPPNGIIYVVKSATSDANCNAMVSPPTIAYWDEGTQQLVDWQPLPDASYASVLPVLFDTGVLERNEITDKAFIGAGLHTEMGYDDLGNVIVTTTLTGTTESIEVVVAP